MIHFVSGTSFTVAQWARSEHERPSQIHLIIHVDGTSDIVIRFKSRKAFDNLMSAMRLHANEVWPLS